MVNVVFVTKNKNSTEDDDDWEDVCEDCYELTINFDDLGYWNIEQVRGKTAPEVTGEIKKVMESLKSQGYRVGIPDDDNPSWMWGHQKRTGYFENGRDLPRHDKVEILMWWLSGLLEIIEKYDNTYYLVLRY